MSIAFPESKFTLLDSNSKKILVVSDIVQKLNLTNVKCIWSRAEEVNEKYDFIVGRAVSALPNFLGFSSHLIKSNENDIQNRQFGLYYLKGGDFKQELVEASISHYDLTKVNSLLPIDSDKSILHIPTVEITKFSRMKVEQRNLPLQTSKSNKKNS